MSEVEDLEDALYLVKRVGLFDAKQYAAKRLGPGVRAVLESLDARQARARNIRDLADRISQHLEGQK